MQVIRPVESHFSVGEMLRVISAVTNQDVNNDVFSKPDKMDEVMWQLVHIYFDMPPKPFKRIYLLVLLNRVCEDLLFPQPFYNSDLVVIFVTICSKISCTYLCQQSSSICPSESASAMAIFEDGDAEESELERDVAELKKKQLEKEVYNRTLADLQNQSMRQKLLLANKKKVLQTKRKEFIKEIEAIKAETQEYQLHFNRIQQKTYHLEGDIKIGEVENNKLERQLQLIDKLGHHLADIHSILKGLD
ncbi:hypothetical protein AHF37_09426 [Paragonimus kellicotti]|nr:hypothetical protein AHF37_09426 [Paragonimus kellicotti]